MNNFTYYELIEYCGWFFPAMTLLHDKVKLTAPVFTIDLLFTMTHWSTWPRSQFYEGLLLSMMDFPICCDSQLYMDILTRVIAHMISSHITKPDLHHARPKFMCHICRQKLVETNPCFAICSYAWWFRKCQSWPKYGLYKGRRIRQHRRLSVDNMIWWKGKYKQRQHQTAWSKYLLWCWGKMPEQKHVALLQSIRIYHVQKNSKVHNYVL